MAKYYSAKGELTAPITIGDLDNNYDLFEIGLTLYSDATYTTVVSSAMTGTVQLSAIPAVNKYSQNIVNGNIDLTSATSFQTPVRIDTKVSSITATPNTVTGATHYQLVVIGQ